MVKYELRYEAWSPINTYWEHGGDFETDFGVAERRVAAMRSATLGDGRPAYRNVRVYRITEERVA